MLHPTYLKNEHSIYQTVIYSAKSEYFSSKRDGLLNLQAITLQKYSWRPKMATFLEWHGILGGVVYIKVVREDVVECFNNEKEIKKEMYSWNKLKRKCRHLEWEKSNTHQ